jgi:hypothetical protein
MLLLLLERHSIDLVLKLRLLLLLLWLLLLPRSLGYECRSIYRWLEPDMAQDCEGVSNQSLMAPLPSFALAACICANCDGLGSS